MRVFKRLLQYCVPHHGVSRLAGLLSQCQWRWWKNWAIRFFMRLYPVNLQEAARTTVDEYLSFNDFFTRHLKPGVRPLITEADHLLCPVDGMVSQAGHIQHDTLIQAKGFDYSLEKLLGHRSDLAALFQDGEFITLYLAPKDYHRVHMPLTGQLRESFHIPGRLFSVSPFTTQSVPHLFTRNERVVCIFDTEWGPMAVILVGAMIVGHIHTVWEHEKNPRASIELPRGAELGHFSVGSTVILLMSKAVMEWHPDVKENSVVRMGQSIGLKKRGVIDR